MHLTTAVFESYISYTNKAKSNAGECIDKSYGLKQSIIATANNQTGCVGRTYPIHIQRKTTHDHAYYSPDIIWGWLAQLNISLFQEAILNSLFVRMFVTETM